MRIDLNADVGEECGQDAALLPSITSANVACGRHAGSPTVMRDTVLLAFEYGVAVGAHPGYADRENFGRRDLQLTSQQITDLVVEQVDALATIAGKAGVQLQHVKPHGALYNIAIRDRGVADAIARAVVSVDPSLILLGLPGSQLVAAGAAAGLRTAREAFADRAYRPDGTLVPRTEPGAVIHDPDQVLARVVALAQRFDVDTICVHGDTPGAADLARRIRETLEAAEIELKNLST
ncbi:MAG TPA: 5-oxoprolinase subunit PxpA [Vicinamibacterales bacterium]|nr:5-oxoprolinase subunit PxpA [Vicinamibacterales bacterium]